MELKQLQYFMTVVDEGSISAAAGKLLMSQPPLSTQMKQLEQELGVVLFERGARHIILTDAGRLLYTRAQSMLHMASVTKKELDNLHNGLRGILRLGFISSCGTEVVQQKLMEFHRFYPDVHFEILEGNTFELLEALENREIEIALIRAPFPSETNLDVCTLYADPMCAAGVDSLFVDPENKRRSDEKTLDKKTLDLTDLAGKPLILYRRWEKEILSAFQRTGITPLVVMTTDDARTSLMWAQAGLGIALVPSSFAALSHSFSQSESILRRYELNDQTLISRLTIVKRRDGKISPPAKQFFQIFKKPF